MLCMGESHQIKTAQTLMSVRHGYSCQAYLAKRLPIHKYLEWFQYHQPSGKIKRFFPKIGRQPDFSPTALPAWTATLYTAPRSKAGLQFTAAQVMWPDLRAQAPMKTIQITGDPKLRERLRDQPTGYLLDLLADQAGTDESAVRSILGERGLEAGEVEALVRRRTDSRLPRSYTLWGMARGFTVVCTLLVGTFDLLAYVHLLHGDQRFGRAGAGPLSTPADASSAQLSRNRPAHGDC